MRDIEAQKIREQRSKKRSSTARKAKNNEGVGQEGSAEIENVEPSMVDGVSSRAAKVVERMTMQNVFDEFSMDLKYWDDNSDTFRPNEASLLPLWRFASDMSSGKQVTSICPHHQHSDVFAVGYGSYEALRQTAGLVSVYSVKNPAVPEIDLPLESGVLTVTFHPEYASILAAGCYDGGLRVMKTDGEMLYTTDSVKNRPSEALWQIFWKRDAGVGELQLYSASADGQLGLWTFTRAEILFEPMMIIETQSHPIHRVAGMLALDFNQVCRALRRRIAEGGRAVGGDDVSRWDGRRRHPPLLDGIRFRVSRYVSRPYLARLRRKVEPFSSRHLPHGVGGLDRAPLGCRMARSGSSYLRTRRTGHRRRLGAVRLDRFCRHHRDRFDTLTPSIAPTQWDAYQAAFSLMISHLTVTPRYVSRRS